MGIDNNFSLKNDINFKQKIYKIVINNIIIVR